MVTCCAQVILLSGIYWWGPTNVRQTKCSRDEVGQTQFDLSFKSERLLRVHNIVISVIFFQHSLITFTGKILLWLPSHLNQYTNYNIQCSASLKITLAQLFYNYILHKGKAITDILIQISNVVWPLLELVSLFTICLIAKVTYRICHSFVTHISYIRKIFERSRQ